MTASELVVGGEKLKMVFSMITDALGISEATGDMLTFGLAGIGAVNWGLIGVTALMGGESFNLVTTLFGTGLLTNTVYTLVGLAGLEVLVMAAE